MPEDLCYLNFITYLVGFKFVGCSPYLYSFYSLFNSFYSPFNLIYSLFNYYTVPLIYSSSFNSPFDLFNKSLLFD